MAEVHNFAFGWITPVLAYALSFLGALLGLVLAVRSRGSTGAGRARWLTLAGISIGGIGNWLAHFMALLGFDVSNAVLRYDITITALGFGIAIVSVCLGVYLVGFGRPGPGRIVFAGVLTGFGLFAAHCTGVLAMRVAGRITYDEVGAVLSLAVGMVTAIIFLWFAVIIRGASGIVLAALLMAFAACSAHYTGMSAIRVQLGVAAVQPPADGVGPFVLLAPVSVLACLIISVLACSTVGISAHQTTASQEALLAQARTMSPTRS